MTYVVMSQSSTFGRAVLGHVDSGHLELDLSVQSRGDQVGLTDS